MLRSASQLMTADANRFSRDCPSRHQKNFKQLNLGQLGFKKLFAVFLQQLFTHSVTPYFSKD